jgi:dephospho-CoA kinase
MPQVIAFAGKIGSGKTTITKSLADALGWSRASFGDYVRKVVRERKLEESRVVLQRVGTELLRADPRDFCRLVLVTAGWRAGQDLLIDGLRHEETIEIIRQLTQAETVQVVFVRISEEVRLGRLVGYEESDPSCRAIVEAHSSEAQVTSNLAKSANFAVDNDGPLPGTISEILKWIDSLKR